MCVCVPACVYVSMCLPREINFLLKVGETLKLNCLCTMMLMADMKVPISLSGLCFVICSLFPTLAGHPRPLKPNVPAEFFCMMSIVYEHD